MFTKILKNKEYLGTVSVTAASIIGAVFSYLLQLFLGRTLSVENFGSFTALLALSYLINVPAMVIGISLVKKVSALYGNTKINNLSALYWYLFKLFLGVGFVIFTIISLFSPAISKSLKIFDIGAVIVFGTTMALSFLNTLPSSYLKGALRYIKFSFWSLLNTFFRFLFPAILVLVGLKLYGVFAGMSIGIILNFFIGYFMLKDLVQNKVKADVKREVKNIFIFSVPVLFTNLFLMALSNIDMIMAKRFLDPISAGYYAGTLTLGKILLFGSTPVTTVMFPMISSKYAKGEGVKSKFFTFLGLQLFVVLTGFIIFQALPGLITTVFFGVKYISSVEYLPSFSIFVLEYVLIYFLVFFCLAVDLKKIFLILIPGVFFQFSYISIYHRNIFDIINANIYAGIISLVLIVSFLILNEKWRKKPKQKNLMFQ